MAIFSILQQDKMFWGLKLEESNNYSQVVENSFHISNATLTRSEPADSTTISDLTDSLVAVHIVIDLDDYILCYLGRTSESNTTLQQALDLNFSEGEAITLYIDRIHGLSCAVDLTGHYTDYFQDEELSTDPTDSELEYDSDGHLNTLPLSELSADFADSELEEDILEYGSDGHLNTLPLTELPPTIEELPDEGEHKGKKNCKRPAEAEGNGLDSSVAKKKKTKKKRKKSEENGDATKQGSAKKQKLDTQVKKKTAFKTAGGTEVEDTEEGSGKIAKAGRKVFVKYTGRLAHNNHIFDSNIDRRKAFLFRLGQGEVVRGWDEGVQGMKVGGKRRLTIPPSQGYGTKGAPPKIPPNSRLIFDIELVDVK